jgi:hypothetical protein
MAATRGITISGPGGTIYESSENSTTATGNWCQLANIDPHISIQAVLEASSAGATAGSTITVQVSNSPLVSAATVKTFNLTCTTDTVTDSTVLTSGLLGSWNYIRAVMTSLTTSTAGSAGFPKVSIHVGGNKTG